MYINPKKSKTKRVCRVSKAKKIAKLCKNNHATIYRVTTSGNKYAILKPICLLRLFIVTNLTCYLLFFRPYDIFN